MITGHCEVCGAPADVAIADMRGTDPVRGNLLAQSQIDAAVRNGFDPGTGEEWFAQWEVTTTHLFCSAHERPPKKTPWKAPPGWRW